MLPDLLQENLDIVFCGTAPGNRSAEQGAYYAGCGNKFYCVLYNSGLIPIQLIPSEYPRLLDYGIGLTDLVKRKAGMDRTLLESDFDVPSFKEKMSLYKPKVICFNGKGAAKEFFGLGGTGGITYGHQWDGFDSSEIFVVPSTSPTAHKHWDERVWKQLVDMLG